jgi:hypothetical protein
LIYDLLESKAMSEDDLRRIEAIVSKLESPQPVSRGSRARAFAASIRYRQTDLLKGSKYSYCLERKPIVASFVRRFPNCVDWSEFIRESKKEYFDRHFYDDARLEELSPHELIRIGQEPIRNRLNERFHEQAIDLVALPKFRSRRFADDFLEQSSHYHRILSWVSTRVRLVGLKLLIHRERNGTFPETLKEIGGSIRDPFTGKDLGYLHDGDLFFVWACGPERNILFTR